MAMFTTYIAWTLIENHGMNEWLAFGVTLVDRIRARRSASNASSSARSSGRR